MYLFLSFVWILAITTALDLTNFACTEKSDCAELDVIIKAKALEDATYGPIIAQAPDLIYADCSTNMGFCSIGCAAMDVCGAVSDIVSGLTCDDTSKICENDLSCDAANDASDGSNTDCTLTGLPKCSTKSVCIPQQSSDCDLANDNIDGSNTDCNTDATTGSPGFGKCISTTIMQVPLTICGPEPCCPEGICSDTHCITPNTICQASGSCSYCTEDAQCDPFQFGLTCDTTNGKCSTGSPVPSPTKEPTDSPVESTPECNDDPCNDERTDCPLTAPSGIDGKCHVKVEFDIDVCRLNKAFKKDKIINDLKKGCVDIGGDGSSICSGGEWSVEAYSCTKTEGAFFDFSNKPTSAGDCPTDVPGTCGDANNKKAANIVGRAAIYCDCSDDDALNEIKDKIISNLAAAKINFAGIALAASEVDDTVCNSGFGGVEANELSVSLVDKDGVTVEKINFTGGGKKMYYYIAIVVGMVGIMFL